jgi:N-acetylmuramoyl-L-alanine amidase
MTAILGLSVAAAAEADRWVRTRQPADFWPDLIPLYWDIAPHIGVRADVAFAQACKETGFGRFGRAVTPAHRNPCGLKIPEPAGKADDDPTAHQSFPTWEVGIRAHLEHLALYAGAPGYPLTYTKISRTRWTGATADPRHFAFIYGKANNSVEGLSGAWAPAADYGQSIVNQYLNGMIAA